MVKRYLYLIITTSSLLFCCYGRALTGVRLELAVSPNNEVYGAVGVYMPEHAFMAFSSRIGDGHCIGVYREKVFAVQTGSRAGFFGTQKYGGAYMGGQYRNAGAVGGVTVGFYWRNFNILIGFLSIGYIDDTYCRLIYAVYGGLGIEIGF